jgi:hypothetical protein
MSEPWLTIESWTSADGKKRCKVVQREDGFLAYVEDMFVTLDERKFGGGIYAFWKPSHSSGLFEVRRGRESRGSWRI